MHVVVVALSLVALSGDNLLVNGSFESPDIPAGKFQSFDEIPGWTKVGGAKYELWDNLFGWLSDDGDQHMESNDTFFEQQVPTVPGRLYEISFAWSPRPGVPDNHVIIEWNGEIVAEAEGSGAGLGSLDWSTTSVTAVATEEMTTLLVMSVNNDPLVGMLIDDFRVVEGCGGDANGDGVLNILDFVAFQAAWVNQEPLGDCDQNGQFNILDFVCFQAVFQQGC